MEEGRWKRGNGNVNGKWKRKREGGKGRKKRWKGKRELKEVDDSRKESVGDGDEGSGKLK